MAEGTTVRCVACFLPKENSAQSSMSRRKEAGNGPLLKMSRQMVQELLATLNEFKSPGPDELNLRILKELAEVISELLAIIFEYSWRTEVPKDWRRANVPTFKKKKKRRRPK